MGLVVRGRSDFEPAPAGPSAAVCIDVVDLGTQDTPYGARSRVRVVWSLEKTMKKNGKPYIVQKTYGRSLHRKSTLRQDLESWRGQAFDDAELNRGFDLEILLGKAAFLSIQHNTKDGTTYANVTAIMPLPKGHRKPLPDPDYVRVCNRENGSPAATHHGHPQGEDGWDADAPPPDDADAPTEEENDDDLVF